MRHTRGLSLFLLLASGCLGGQTAYVPVVRKANEAVRPATPYALGGDPGRGTIQVLAVAVERLPVGPDAPEYYLHLRLLAENGRDETVWRFNPNEQMLGHSGGLLAAAFSRSSGPHPVLSVSQGKSGWLDLYYPLPADHDPHEVTLWWRVRRGDTTVNQTTTLLRTMGRNPPPDPSVMPFIAAADRHWLPSGLGLGWWWPDYCFHSFHYGDPYYRRRNHDTGWRASTYAAEESPIRERWNPPPDPSPASSTPSYPTADTAASWRNPSAGEAGPSPGDEAKSSWRR